jgi:hypothetical protein
MNDSLQLCPKVIKYNGIVGSQSGVGNGIVIMYEKLLKDETWW